MSGHVFDDKDMPGYFLPEDGQFRLARLSDYITFLSRLAQPRVADEARECAPEVRMGQLAFCLELLADQVDLVLDEVSWPALRTGKASAAERDAVDEAVPEAPGTETDRFLFGVTLEQVDRLRLLFETISAHADVVVASHTADFADHTLPMVGDTIFKAAAEMREVLTEVLGQSLREPRLRSGVGEERAVYAVGLGSPAAGSQHGPALPLSTCQPLERAGRSCGVRLH